MKREELIEYLVQDFKESCNEPSNPWQNQMLRTKLANFSTDELRLLAWEAFKQKPEGYKHEALV